LASKKKQSGKQAVNGSNGLKVYKVETLQQRQDKRIRNEKNIQTFLIVLIIILAIAAIFLAIHAFFPNVFSSIFGKYTLQGELAATVNGVQITVAQLDQEYARLPLQYQYFITKEDFLQQLIDETLLVQEAGKQGIAVNQTEVDESLNLFMQDNNVTQAELDDLLVQKNLTLENLRTIVYNQLLIDKLLAEQVASKVNVTTAMALQYYNDNTDTFIVPEQVTVRHILIALVNRTPEEAKQIAENILAEILPDKSNFCELVTDYSDDAGSTDNCGEYAFSRGQMVAEFEDAAFSMPIGNISIINTTYGYHVLWVVNKTGPALVLFQDVQDQIINSLAQQQQNQIYSDYIVGLRSQADIMNYYAQSMEQENQTAGEEQAATEANAEEIAEIPPAAEEAQGQEVAEVPGEEIVEQQETLEKETEPVIEETIEPAAPEQASFAQCLTSKEVTLYGAYWDSSTETQLEYFGIDADNTNYVECGVQGDYRAQTQECAKENIQAYPTWIIDGDKHLGIQSLQELATLTGCVQ